MKLSEGLKKKANKLKIKSVQLNLSILVGCIRCFVFTSYTVSQLPVTYLKTPY
jgi:hypothetical protein